MKQKIDDLEKIIINFDSPFTDNTIKSILKLIQYLNNHNLSNDNQISNFEVISIDEELCFEDQQKNLETLILSSIPQENFSFSLFAIHFKDHWNSFITYFHEEKVHAKYNDPQGNQIPEILVEVLNTLQSDGVIETWEDCRTIIPGGRLNDSGPKTIRNLLEMVDKPDHFLNNTEMPMKYYEILRISYVICHIFIEILDTSEIRTYLSEMLHNTHTIQNIEHKTDWLEEMIKDVCLGLKDKNLSENYTQVLNACEEGLKHFSTTPSSFTQEQISECLEEQTFKDINLLYTQKFSTMNSIDLEEKEDYISSESENLNHNISSLNLDISSNSFVAPTINGSKYLIDSDINTNSDGTTLESCDIQNTSYSQKILNNKTAAFETCNQGKQKDGETRSADPQNTSSDLALSKLLKQHSSIAPYTSEELLDGSISQSQDLYVTQSLDFIHYPPLRMQTTDSIANDKVNDDMHSINLDSSVQGNALDSHNTTEKDNELKPLLGENICKTH